MELKQDINNDFYLSMEQRQYDVQYANVYLQRLAKIRQKAYKQGHDAWGDMIIENIPVKYSEKVLEVGRNKYSWVVGTIYREMKLKPSILEEVATSVSTHIYK